MSTAAWIAAGAASLAFHATLGGVLALAIHPAPLEPQAPPETRLLLAAYEVRRSEAVAAEAPGEAVPAGDAEPTALSQDTLPRVAALSQAPTSTAAPALAAAGVRVAPQQDTPAASVPASTVVGAQAEDVAPREVLVTASLAPSAVAAAARPEAATLPAGQPPATAATAVAPPADEAAPVSSATEAVPAAAPPAPAAAVLEPDAPASEAEPLAGVQVAGLAPDSGPALSAAAPEAVRTDPLAPPSPGVAGSDPPAPAAAAVAAPAVPADEMAAAAIADGLTPATPPSDRVTAALAWSGDNQAAVDPVSLAAIQAFMSPSDLDRSRLDAGSVRDGIEGLLAQVPCARLQAAFIPETGSLELRGHVPEEGLRAPVLAALQAQVGGSIPVRDNLLILPRPQCGALAGIAALGLPQSTDQETDARLVGADAHARLYRYGEGDRMIFDLTAPDYPAYVYVDYFDADGMVIHLVPNDRVTLERRPAKSEVTIGGDRPDGNVLAVTVGPPYGQEIAAAFAASEPLYDGVRPTVEPAAPYLDWLRERVGAARAGRPDFKGEWVYFFVATSARQ